nr:MAG TPA: hypothetical protein [Caudoviricetes sp.]
MVLYTYAARMRIYIYNKPIGFKYSILLLI